MKRRRSKPRSAHLRALPSRAEPGGTSLNARPVITLSAELHEDVDASSEALTQHPNVYVRGHHLVRMLRATDSVRGRAAAVRDTPVIRRVSLATLRENLAAVARFQKADGRTKDGEHRSCLASLDVVKALLDRGEWSGVRQLVGIVEAPSMRPDGTLIQAAGYDRATCYLYVPNERFDAIPEEPTQQHATIALERLRDVLADFPFVSEAARFVPLALAMTILVRPSIDGAVPAFLLDAATRGTGKTLVGDVAVMMATGRAAAKIGYAEKPAEREKVLDAYALSGAAVIAFDNVASTFGGPALDRCLTAGDMVELRELGRSKVHRMPWRAVITGNGNNMVIAPDTTRRVLLARMESPLERPEERTGFQRPRLLRWVQDNRTRLVGDALTVLRAHAVAGWPSHGVGPWGSFEDWTAKIAAAIAWAGGPNVLEARPTFGDGVDHETEALRALLAELHRLTTPDGKTTRMIVQALYQHARPLDDGLRDAVETLANMRDGQTPTAQALGRAFGRVRKRVIGGRRLNYREEAARRRLWFVETMGGGE